MVRYSNSTKTEAVNATTNPYDATATATVAAAGVDVNSNQMTTSSVGGVAHSLSARAALDKTKATAIAVTYDFGLAKVFYGTSSIKSSTTVAQIKSNTTGVSVPFGAFNVAYAVSSEKGTSDGTGLDSSTTVINGVTDLVSGDTVSTKGSRLFVTYALSKRTTLYGMSGKATVDSVAADASTLKTTTTSVGIKHAF